MKAALILGGPSLKTVDLNSVEADVFVGANWSFLLPRVSLNVVVDYRLMDKLILDDRFYAWVDAGGKNYFVDHCRQKRGYPDSENVLSTYPTWPQYPQRPGDGLYCRAHAGLSALSLACLIAEEVDIYGLDMNSDDTRAPTVNWHQEHEAKWAGTAKSSYPAMLRATDEAAAKIPKSIKIRNMNTNSACKSFEFPK